MTFKTRFIIALTVLAVVIGAIVLSFMSGKDEDPSSSEKKQVVSKEKEEKKESKKEKKKENGTEKDKNKPKSSGTHPDFTEMYVHEEYGSYVFLTLDTSSEELKGTLQMVELVDSNTPSIEEERYTFVGKRDKEEYVITIDSEEADETYRLKTKKEYLFLASEEDPSETILFKVITGKEKDAIIEKLKKEKVSLEKEANEAKEEFYETLDSPYGYYYKPDSETWYHLFVAIDKREKDNLTGTIIIYYDTGNKQSPIEQTRVPFTASLDMPNSFDYEGVKVTFVVNEENSIVKNDGSTTDTLEGTFSNDGERLQLDFLEDQDALRLEKVSKETFDMYQKAFKEALINANPSNRASAK